MYSRLIKYPTKKSFFLFGPRGTGKTTWVKTTFPNALYLDLLEGEIYNELLANPQRLENQIPKNFLDFIIIDEVQRIPQLLNEVHRLIEKYSYKFILTGSSARKLRKSGENLLAGRALTCLMYPLTAFELGQDFNLNHAINFGQLPSIYKEEDIHKYLESYVQTYLREEIYQEGLTRNLSAFARFLEIASFSQGSVLNTSEVAREAAIERKVVENYFSILEDLLIGYKLPVFNKKAKRRMISKPKFYFFDTGVFRAIRPTGPLDMPEMIDGAACETLFLQNLLAVNHGLDLGYKIYYYKTASGIEMDFVAYGKKGLYAFEIKRSGKVSSDAIRNLKNFLKEYPQAKCFLIYGGTKKIHEGEIEVIPMQDALLNLPKILQ
jgi:predicted AAA+ superfamily ATPase